MLAHTFNSKERTQDVANDNDLTTFESFILPENVMTGLTKAGFKKPSPIQFKAIPVGRCGFDLIVKSKSGTGKTLVFTVIALEAVDVSLSDLQIIILAPTREIAVQIQEVIQTVGCSITGLKVESFIGGLPVADDKEKCKACHVAVGTPGRVKHLIKEGVLSTTSVRLLVLDEADKLMEESFRNDINDIYKRLPSKKQIITTSATYPGELETFLSNYMLCPSFITSELHSPLLLGLKQFVKVVKSHANVVQQMKTKNEELVNIFSNISFTQCLVFSNYQTRAESISNILNQKGWHSTFISAAQSQAKRLTAISDLKNFKCRILLSTDLTARGIDAANVDLVINFDIPADPVTYLHRMGRTGRYGSSGVCINLASEDKELKQLQNILGFIGGTALSVPLLPKFTGNLSELLCLEVPPGNSVNGTVEKAAECNLRKDIMELKTRKDRLDEVTQSETSPNIVASKSDDMDLLNNTTNEVNSIKQHIASMNTDDILESLATGNFSMLTDNLRNSNEFDQTAGDEIRPSENSTEVALSEEMSVVKDLLSGASMKKKHPKSRTGVAIAPEIGQHNLNQKNAQQMLFCKNHALLNMAKILQSPELAKTADGEAVKQYLELKKKQEMEEVSKLVETKEIDDIFRILVGSDSLENNDVIDSTNNETNQTKLSLSPLTLFESGNIEDVFKLGYETIVKQDSVIWKNWVSKLEEDRSIKEVSYCEDEEGMSEVGYDEEVTDDVMEWVSVKKKTVMSSESAPDNTDCDLMKWIPVEKAEVTGVRTCEMDAERSVDSYEHFSGYFRSSDEMLWHNGFSFQDVTSFDDWFHYEWQAQVSAVRNYIQQHIYVQEMSRYQNSRTVNKNSDSG